MIKTKDSFKGFIKEIIDITKRNTSELEKGKTFQTDPGLPIYPFIIAGIVVLVLSYNSHIEISIISEMLFCSFITLHYFCLWIFAKSEYIDQLEKNTITKGIVTINFIFRKILEQSFLWVLIASIVFIFVPEIVQLLIFTFVTRYVIWCTMTITSNNACPQCGSLWSYQSENRVKIIKNINNKWLVPDITQNASNVVCECENCGHKVKV